jgi:probable rRNA maturation factor
MSIDIANEAGIDVDEARLVALARFTLEQMQIHPLAELSLLLVDERTMTDLHERWMGEPGPTDVLSFPMDELRPPHLGGNRTDPEPAADPSLLGDVVLCPQVAAEQAVKAGHTTQDELELLCVHGILHLLGYDHAEPDEHAEMFGLQGQLLTAWRKSQDAGQADVAGQAGVAGQAQDAGQAAQARPGLPQTPEAKGQPGL